jgi:hypothetical protein
MSRTLFKSTLVLLFVLPLATNAQLANTESTSRTPNSVEIQACLNPNVVISSHLSAVRAKLLSDFQTQLKSSAVYHIQTYTNTVKNVQPGTQTEVTGGTCFLYVYQAISPEKAREAITVISVFPKVSIIQVEGGLSETIPVNVKAFPWTPVEDTFMSLGWNVKGTDLILWGACLGALLVFCVIGVCILAHVSILKEHALAEKILKEDRKILMQAHKNDGDK